MPNTFDEARAGAEEMLANEQLSLADVPPTNKEIPPSESEKGTEPPPAKETLTETLPTGTEDPTAQQLEPEALPSPIEQAVQTAEVAAQAAAEKDNQLQQAMAEIEALKQQNQQLQGTIDEMSRHNTNKIIEDALTPPTLDINGLAFADEETQRAAMAKYAEDMSAFNRQQLMQELSPALEYAKEGMREKEKTEALSILSQIPELSGIKEMMPQLERIIAGNKWLQSEEMPMDEKLVNAFAIATGVNSINTPPPEPPKEPTTDEFMKLYNSNPAFQEMVEKQRIEQVKRSQQVPTFSASSGAANAALNIQEKPKSFDEVLESIKRGF